MATVAAAIAPQLPFLRRYARAVSGSQIAGDAMVASLLRAIVADVSRYPKATSDRVALYKAFARAYHDNSAGQDPSQPDWERKAAAKLSQLSTTQRHAFLLVAVEGFSSTEAAEILDVSPEKFELFLAEANDELSRQLATDIMIIEDELMIAMDLEQIVESLGHQVVGVARTRDEAKELFKERRPRLILADIKLADGSSGIDAVNDIVVKSPTPVIFITAFPERLLTGDRPEPAFLVTKPFMADMVKALISQALFFDRQASIAA